MCKCPFCHFNKHCKCSFLKTVANVLNPFSIFMCSKCCTEQTWKWEIHTFYNIRQVNVWTFLSEFFNNWPSRMSKTGFTTEMIKAVTNGYIQGFTKDPVSAGFISNHLTVSTTYIKGYWITGTSVQFSYFYMTYTVIYTNNRNIKTQCKCSCWSGYSSKCRAKTWTLWKRDEINILIAEACLFHSLWNELRNPFGMMFSSFPWMYASLFWIQLFSSHSQNIAITVYNANSSLFCSPFNS